MIFNPVVSGKKADVAIGTLKLGDSSCTLYYTNEDGILVMVPPSNNDTITVRSLVGSAFLIEGPVMPPSYTGFTDIFGWGGENQALKVSSNEFYVETMD